MSVQELLKGQVPSFVIEESDRGGWRFNDASYGSSYCKSYIGGEEVNKCGTFMRITPPQANVLDSNMLKTKPLFDMNPAHSTIPLFSESAVNLNEAKIVELLANEVPALTFATGHRGTSSFPTDTNIDIRKKYLKEISGSQWPRGDDDYEWRHSDLYNVAYPYVYRLYNDWVTLIKGGTL